METRLMTLQQVFAGQAERERQLLFRHRWVGLVWNYVIGLTVVVLFWSFVWWGNNVNTERKVAERTATAVAEMEAQRQAEAEAEAAELAALKASEDYIIGQEATELAKAFYGIRLFVDKYGYTEKDFETYARCIFNRADAGNGNLIEVIRREGQFLGYSEQNPVIDEYYEMALKFVQQWHSETTKPVDASYQFAELTESGIWLKNDINADGYARRWRA